MNRVEVYKDLLELDYRDLEKTMHDMRMCTDVGRFRALLNHLSKDIRALQETLSHVSNKDLNE